MFLALFIYRTTLEYIQLKYFRHYIKNYKHIRALLRRHVCLKLKINIGLTRIIVS